MIDIIIQKDKELLVFLNNLGTEQWDPFWLAITNQLHWAPLFIFVFFLVIKSKGWKRGGFIIFCMILLVAFSDQFVNLIKDSTERLRPNNDIAIQSLLRTFIRPQSFSFLSGHATTSTFFTVFTILLLKDHFKYMYLMCVFPLLFSYSRLYLGVHFPIDISLGILTGIVLGRLYFLLYRKVDQKLFG
ncbi:phosphatase PAP2 family protein [Polaribacter sp. HL-MS24]|uniref:phosphatase PAP2 family protein n=1 Tax=Polaribacter sp. HL-MS24 TaxID=3077735 RepID=UPI00293518A1|nr:phosphatase PAP2 family protein [Polaribacter sp. HL-MS24]WOC40337.1 phosphatase PAP2 family protein [Polaribacter sp. HL-MS24]